MSWLSSLFEPPSSQVPLPQQWQAPNLEGTAWNSLAGIGGMGQFNTAGQSLPQYGDITQNLVNNPYAGAAQQGAGQAGALGMQGALNQFSYGGNLYGAGNQVLNTGFDPQNDLYNRSVQQLQDQTRVGQAARGIAMTPYGAGLENQALSNFNIDWQNQQLGRQTAALGSAGGAYGQAGSMQGQAPAQFYTGASMPYQTYQSIGQNQLGALGSYGQFGQQAAQIPQQQIADWNQYLGIGNASNQVANQGAQNALNQANQGFNQQQTTFGNIGKTIGAVAPYALAMFSDERLKENIEPVGEMFDGQPVYAYNYKGDPTPRIGLMAQDVEHVEPDAVGEVGGFKVVDYGRATALSRGIAALSAWG